MTTKTDETARAAVAYHERSKHDTGRFARSAGFLDWSTQPEPFRRYDRAPLVKLPLPGPDPGPALPYDALFHPGTHPDGPEPHPLDLEGLSRFFFHSLALSAHKSADGARWSLRVNPSSGNLHPSEGWLLAPALPGLGEEPGVYHYAPREHGLERRARLPAEAWAALSAGLPSGGFLVALSSVPWRESWKYGERAWRYCQHDAGHALAALRFAAALLGWRLVVLPRVPDQALATLLGLDREADFHAEERELPDLLAAVWPGPAAWDPSGWRPAWDALRPVGWSGPANQLSPGHHPWPVLDEVERACRKTASWCEASQLTAARPAPVMPRPPISEAGGPAAAAILRQRRSAVSMDGHTGLAREGFFDLLARLVPARTVVPWDALCWPSFVHLGLFVHRVQGLDPGLYALLRDEAGLAPLRAACDPDFAWERPAGCPAQLPLFLLRRGDLRSLAGAVSCGQDIAADGAFSLGMLAAFEAPLAAHGAPVYRHLFWETGAIGQVLYLEAEAYGLRGTGIGCFFDDPVHRVFGLRDRSFQSLYHFTLGGPVDDARLTTEPAYPQAPA